MKLSGRRDTGSLQMRFNLVFLIIAILCLLSIKVRSEDLPDIEVWAKSVADLKISQDADEVFELRDIKTEEDIGGIENLQRGKKYYVRMRLDSDGEPLELLPQKGMSKPPHFKEDGYVLKGVKILKTGNEEMAAKGYYELHVLYNYIGQVEILLKYMNSKKGGAAKVKFIHEFKNRLAIRPKYRRSTISSDEWTRAEFKIHQKYREPLTEFSFGGQSLSQSEVSSLNSLSSGGSFSLPVSDKAFHGLIQGSMTFKKNKNGSIVVTFRVKPRVNGQDNEIVTLDDGEKVIRYKSSSGIFKKYLKYRFGSNYLDFPLVIKAKNKSGNEDRALVVFNHDSDDWGSDGANDGTNDMDDNCLDQRGKEGSIWMNLYAAAGGVVQLTTEVGKRTGESRARVTLKANLKTRAEVLLKALKRFDYKGRNFLLVKPSVLYWERTLSQYGYLSTGDYVVDLVHSGKLNVGDSFFVENPVGSSMFQMYTVDVNFESDPPNIYGRSENVNVRGIR